MRKTDPKIITEIVRLYQSGLNQQEVADQLSIARETVYKYLKQSGIKARRVHYWYDQSVYDEIVNLYNQGLSQSEIERVTGKEYKLIRSHLKRAGVAIRPKAYYSKGSRNPAWKGGRRLDKSGYVLIYSPDHPYRDGHNRVREHRLVMEKYLGRYLLPGEVVDHINGVKNDNRLKNLRLFASNAEHLAATLKNRCPKWTVDGKRRIALGVLKSHKTRRSKRGVSPSPRSNESRSISDTLAA